MSDSIGPQFLCIGAAKAGTTWLWENLQLHPDFWMPPVKELHWFDSLYPPPEVVGNSEFRHRMGVRRYGPLLRRPTLRTLLWLNTFYSSLERGGNYARLFDSREGAHTGDITPAYAILDEKTVKTVHSLIPSSARIIFIMREPVDRLWSGLRMYCRQRKVLIRTLDEDALYTLSRMPEHVLRTDYARTLKNWSCFERRLGLFFYEDLRNDPRKFLKDILDFLGANSQWQSPLLTHISNAGETSMPLPDSLRKKWQHDYIATVDAVRRTVGRVPAEWDF